MKVWVHPYMEGKLVVLRGEREIVGVPIPCVTLGIAILVLHIPQLYCM